MRNELRLGEKSFREAVAAYVNDSKTVANIRFRQARDQYQDALTRIERSDQDIFREQIEVSNKIGIDPPPEKIADIPVLSDESISALNKYGIELITDIGNGNPSMIVPDDIDKLNNNISTEYREFDMIVISWWYDEESQVFDSRKTVSIRCNQAERGFEET